MAYNRDDETQATKVIGNKFVDLAQYVHFDLQGAKLPDKVFYPVLMEILQQCGDDEAELREALITRKHELSPKHILLEDAEIISAEFTGDGYTLGLSWNGYQILARSIAKPRKREVSIAIPREKAEIFRS